MKIKPHQDRLKIFKKMLYFKIGNTSFAILTFGWLQSLIWSTFTTMIIIVRWKLIPDEFLDSPQEAQETFKKVQKAVNQGYTWLLQLG